MSSIATTRPARGSLLVRLLHGPNFVRIIAPRRGQRLGVTRSGDIITINATWPPLLRRCAALIAVLVLGAAAGLLVPAAAACGAYMAGHVDARLRR